MYEFQTDKYVFEVHTGVNKRKLVQNDPAQKLVTPTGNGTISDSSSGHSETPKKNLFSSKKRRKLLKISQLAKATGGTQGKDDHDDIQDID